MNDDRPDGVHHPALEMGPLPGKHPILTLQIAVTAYQATGAMRVSVSIREPGEKQALYEPGPKLIEDADDDFSPVLTLLHQALLQIDWLTGWRID